MRVGEYLVYRIAGIRDCLPTIRAETDYRQAALMVHIDEQNSRFMESRQSRC